MCTLKSAPSRQCTNSTFYLIETSIYCVDNLFQEESKNTVLLRSSDEESIEEVSTYSIIE